MGDTLIQNIGGIITGDVEEPLLSADSMYIQDGLIAEIGSPATSAETVIDANGLYVTPGLIDAHVHPVFGSYTPRQQTIGWPESYLHCGITSMVSASEAHLPGRPQDVTSLKALAVLAKNSYDNHRPGGSKMHGGTLIATDEMTESDIEEVHQKGVQRIKFLFPLEDWDRGSDLATWARERDMVSIMHTGSSSFQENPIEFDVIDTVRPDIVAHLSGGPIPISEEQVNRTIRETSSAIELVLSGSQKLSIDITNELNHRGELSRLQFGTDTPSGTGVVSRGLLMQIAIIASLSDISPEETLCVATGNAAVHHRLDEGFVEEGRPADLCLLGPSVGSSSDSLFDALISGELPAVEMVLTDGTVVVEESRNMPSAKSPADIVRN